MSDPRPAFHCGADDCCTGGSYPECQEHFSLGHPTPSHYEDEAPLQDGTPYTD